MMRAKMANSNDYGQIAEWSKAQLHVLP